MNEGLKFGLVKGRTPVISDAIKWFTGSPYSHANIVLEDGTVYEAEPNGFERFAALAVNNSGCTVDLFAYDDPLSIGEVADATAFLESLRGQGYDFPMLLSFLQRLNFEPPASRKLLFCSEAVMLVSQHLGPSRELFRNMPPWKLPPGFIIHSTRIHWIETIQLQ